MATLAPAAREEQIALEAPPSTGGPFPLRRPGTRLATLALGSALAAVAFGAQGGSNLSRTTIVELALTIASGVIVAIALLRARGGRLDGGLTLGAFATLTALTAISIIWSIIPDQSWLEANRTLTYLLVLAAAIAAGRLAPDSYAVVLRAILFAAIVITAYALASRIWPATLASDEIYARLGQPYGYWNALGATAALAVPAALWLGTRRSGHSASNALAYPLLSLLVVTMFLSYSRGALLFAAIAAVAWVVLVPLRLRSLTVLSVSLAGAAPMVLWTLSKDAFTKNQVPLSVRESVSTQFGLFVLATVVVVLAVALLIQFRLVRRPPRLRTRLVLGLAATLVACAVPAAMFAALVASDRGLTGTIKADYESLTSSRGSTPGGPSRLTTASNSRGLYWHQARQVFDHNQLHGTGAGTYGVARLRYRRDDLVAMHAHGYVMQTLSDFGILGGLAIALLAITWLIAAVRATGLTIRPRRRLPHGSDRVAVLALALTTIVYALHSVIEWIWFIPGPTVMAVVAGGFVVGRGPLRARFAVPAPVVEPPPADAPTEVMPALAGRVLARGRALGRPLRRVPRPLLALAALAATFACAWTIWQPLRSDNISNDALKLSARHRYAAALRDAADARRIDPLTPKPLVVRASIEDAAGHRVVAERVLERAVVEFRSDPQVWLQLAEYQLSTLNRPAATAKTIQGALYLDPQNPEAQTVLFSANARLGAPAGTPAPAPSAPQLTPRASGGPAG
jgi:hypothetical protein